MSGAGQRTRTKKIPEFGLVAFVDILGFSERIKRLPWNGQSRSFDKLKRDVQSVQDAFEHRSQDTYTRQSHKITRKAVLAFTDCVVIAVPLQSPSTASSGVFDVLCDELYAMALAQAECVMKGVFLRGGVDVGWWYKKKDTLISSALVKAYEHEKLASVPIIALTKELSDFLEHHPGRGAYSKDIDPIKRLFRKNPRTKKSFLFLDYLWLFLLALDPVFSPGEITRYRAGTADLKDELRTNAYHRACKLAARKHGRVILRGYRQAKGANIKAKYSWLIAYHNECMRRFFRQDANKFILRKR